MASLIHHLWMLDFDNGVRFLEEGVNFFFHETLSLKRMTYDFLW